MREILYAQVAGIKQQLDTQYPHLDLNIIPAMSYGNPGIQAVLKTCRKCHKSM